jgi:protein phosphatase
MLISPRFATMPNFMICHLMRDLLMFDTGAATHIGKVRRRNEDSYLVSAEVGLWVVADGMGGHDAGDFASKTVVEALRSIPPQVSASDLLARCEESLIRANLLVREAAQRRGGGIIGTTIAGLLIYDGHYACVWSGDSRLYLARDSEIFRVSRDHTEVQELLAAGTISEEEARTWNRRNVITRAIGVSDVPELDMESGVLEPGDTFVVCSDGLTNYIADDEILHCVTTRAPQQACDTLIALTLERGAADNVTVVVVRYDPGDSRQKAIETQQRDLWE